MFPLFRHQTFGEYVVSRKRSKKISHHLVVPYLPSFMWGTFSIFSRSFKTVRSKDLVTHWKIHVDDNVVINSGKAKGCRGRVVSVDQDRNTVKVQGCNLYCVKDKQGTRRLVPRAVHYSNVNLVDPVTDSAVRVKLRPIGDDGTLERVSRKSGTLLAWPKRDVSPTRVKPNATTGVKDTEVEFALEKSYNYEQDVAAMKLVRESLTKYNTA
jgi:large subunit ribosomal protein L24